MISLPRRTFLKASLGTVSFPLFSELAAADHTQTELSPHFLMIFMTPGGMDATYTFDARPLELTTASLLQNYLGVEPALFTGSNGQNCLMTSCVQSLLPHLDRFSVLNGVVMDPSANSHGENQAFLLTGDVFGGTSLFQQLSEQTHQLMNLAKITPGYFEGESRIHTKAAIDASPKAVKMLAEQYQLALRTQEDIELNNDINHLMGLRRFPSGGFKAAHDLLLQGFGKIPLLTEKLGSLTPEDSGESNVVGDVAAIYQFFKGGLATCGFYKFDTDLSEDLNLDVHDPGSAKKMPQVAKKVAEEIAAAIEYMKTTAFDEQNSLLDVTTVLIGSEFSRTMRQMNVAIDNTGTDHNPLTNTFLMGGKGIKGGLVLGESDFASSTEALSGAHLQLDKNKMSIMGRPFDYTTGRSSQKKPPEYLRTDYLSSQSVVNSIFEVFHVKKSIYRLTERNGSAWPVIRHVLN